MPRKQSTLSHEREIIDSLKRSSKSMQALADELKINYYTVRRIMDGLRERNIVRVVDTVERASIFGYVGDEREHDYIPRITDIVNKVTVKSIVLMDSAGAEDKMKAVLAAKRVPYHITNLMRLSLQAESGLPVGQQLDRVREELTKDYLYAKNVAGILEQLLKEPRFWHEKHLARMSADPDFNPSIVLQTWEYYTGLLGDN